MARRALDVATTLGVILSACSGSSGSGASKPPFFVQGVLSPAPVATGQSCSFSADPGQKMLATGKLDLAFSGSYTATVLLGNDLPADADASVQQSSAIDVQGASVRIEDETGTVVRSFSALLSGLVSAPSGGAPGYEPLAVPLLDAMATAGVKGQVSVTKLVRLTSHVTLTGRTLGGRQVQSDEFAFPIDVCKGCLVTFSPGDVSPSLPMPNCAAASGPSSAPVPCVVGQDTPIDCADCLTVHACQ